MSDSNTISASDAKRWYGEIERHLATLETYKGEHMQRCKSVREQMSDVYDRAADAGIPKRALKAVVKAKALEAKAEAARLDLDDEDTIESFDQIRVALGDFADTPLGNAAVTPAAKPSRRKAALDQLNALASGDDADGEFERAGAENAERLKSGISSLN